MKNWVLLIVELILVMILYACTSQLNKVEVNEYSVTKLKSKTGGAYLNVGLFHYSEQNKRTYATVYINNIIYIQNKLEDRVIHVLPGEFELGAAAIGKVPINLERLKLAKSDSLIIKIYLMDEDKNLHE